MSFDGFPKLFGKFGEKIGKIPNFSQLVFLKPSIIRMAWSHLNLGSRVTNGWSLQLPSSGWEADQTDQTVPGTFLDLKQT